MLIIILLLSLLTPSTRGAASPARPASGIAQDSASAPFKCPTPAPGQGALIRRAEAEGYTVRRVEFLGNEYTRDNLLRRRLLLRESELFTRENLVASLRNLSRLRVIHPVGLDAVELRLGEPTKEVDISICFRERRGRQPRRRAS